MPEPALDVLVVGSINQDHVVVADAFPTPGETIHGRSTRSSIGGKGANQAVAAARAPATVAIAGIVGDDAAGAFALDTLRAHGVDTSLVHRRAGVETGSAWITVAAGDNTIVVVAGANADWPAGWPASDDAARAARDAAVILCQLEVPVRVVQAAADACAGQFVLNAAPAAQLPDTVLAACDVLVVNEHELAVLTGADDRALSADRLEQIHGDLRARGVGAVLTTLGADGAVLTDSDGTHHVASPPAQAVDTTGAGDAFAGVLCARLAHGDRLLDAVRWAAGAGSLAVRAAGTLESYPDAATLADLMRDRAS